MEYLERKRIAKCNYFNSFNFFHPHFLLNSSWLQEMKFLSVNWFLRNRFPYITGYVCLFCIYIGKRSALSFASEAKKSFWVLYEKWPMTRKRIFFHLRWSYLKTREKRYRAWFESLICGIQLQVKVFPLLSFRCFILTVMVIILCSSCRQSSPEFRALQANKRCSQGQCNFTMWQ